MSMTKESLDMLNNEKNQKAYSKPTLIQYGKVEEITKGTTGSGTDFGGAMNPRM
jgi:hypothetical protein